MKKKLILTESQYNRLQEFLFENKYDNIVTKLEQTNGLDFEEKLDAITKILGTTNHQQTYDKIESVTSKPINDLLIHADYDDGMEMVNALIKAYQERSQALNQQKGSKTKPTANSTQSQSNDINHILDFANVGDDLKFKTSQNADFSIKVVSVDQNNNEILGDNHGNKIKMSFNAFDDKTKQLNYQELNKTTNQFENKTGDVIGLEIERNGKPLQIPNAGNGNQPPVPPQKPKVDLDPNTETPYTVDMDPNQTNIGAEELKAAGEAAKRTIDYTKDPLLKKAFHRQASFWDQFNAELSGKKAEPDGIKSVLDMLGKYTNKKIKDKFGEVFTHGKRARFKILTRSSLIDTSKIYEFLIRNWTEGDADTITLSEPNKSNGFRLIVNERKKNENDKYECTLKIDVDGIEQEEKVEVEFFKSAGYSPILSDKKQNK